MLAGLGATAMCDVSDGLVQDVGHLAQASGVRIVLDAGLLPLPPGVDLQDALTGGEDHALVAVLPAGTPLPHGVRRIGRVEAGEGVEVTGARVAAASGWQHFGPDGTSSSPRSSLESSP